MMTKCLCGCGQLVSKEGNKYIHGHYIRVDNPMKDPRIAKKNGETRLGENSYMWKGGYECYDCGLEYRGPGWIEAIIPDKVWSIISPTGDQGGILCIICIAKRLSERDLKNIPVLLCGAEPLKAMIGDPGDIPNDFILREWKPKNT